MQDIKKIKLEVMKQMLKSSLVEQISLEVSIEIKQNTIIGLITPATEQLRNKMEEAKAKEQFMLEEQKKIVKVLSQKIEDEENAK